MATESTHWTATEFAQLDLGDARLDKRARILMERFAADPTASIPMACHGWGETIAAYRFLGNADVEWADIMAPHWQQTRNRMQAHPVVLCLQDTTELDFNGQETAGLGPLSYEMQRGMYLHPTYAVTPQREPLGVLDAWMWAREKRDESGVRGGLKESTRWIEGYERIAEMAVDMPATRLVYVADREADLMAMMLRAHTLNNPADWLVRASHNRCLPEGEKLWSRTCHGEALGEITFAMASRDGVKARTVKQHLWSQQIDLPNGKRGTIPVTCVIAREFDAPAGTKPIEWRLLTNRTAASLEEVIELINWYRARWEIEIFFNILKNACKIEALQLSGIDRLERALALFMVVAWRIAHLMRLGRTCPDLDATLFFDPDEIRGAYLLTKTKQPAVSSLNNVLRLVARLGGFLGRKGDGHPGVKAIWEGLQKVQVAAETLQGLRFEQA